MCLHFSMGSGVDEKLRAAGWGTCALGSDIAGTYQSQAAACQFEPSRFKAQGVEVPRETPAAREDQPAPCDLPEELDFG